MYFFFFFKQKTAYEMRISDWSSDVCSSDLLVEQLSARAVHRQYLAIVVGALVSGGTASGAIDRHPRDRLRMAVRDDGRDATTHYRLRERFRAHTALECRLETGRPPQIRVHMAHLKHPNLGNPLYGRPLKLPRDRQSVVVEQRVA